jgi:hypothetical protein
MPGAPARQDVLPAQRVQAEDLCRDAGSRPVARTTARRRLITAGKETRTVRPGRIWLRPRARAAGDHRTGAGHADSHEPRLARPAIMAARQATRAARLTITRQSARRLFTGPPGNAPKDARN